MAAEFMSEARSTWPEPSEVTVQTLGPCQYPSPIDSVHHEPWVEDADRVLLCSDLFEIEPLLKTGRPLPSFEPAGPRSKVFFDTAKLTCGVLTCGGLCPGLNNVVRSIVLRLTYAYGVQRILGFRYGYAGLAPKNGHEPLPLTPHTVDSLQQFGGTMLGSSRGPQDLGEMAENLQRLGVGILFVIGGDGGLRGASALAGELTRRDLPISVIGVPKTIDNDLDWTWRSFGFDTAVSAATTVITAAHEEARAAWNGVGLVKLMGRHSGFIAAHATLASSDVNICLVPEVPFTLEGEGGFLHVLEQRLDEKRHAVVVVAEGAGQGLLEADGEPQRDASGNVRLKDIGTFLRGKIGEHLATRGKEVNIRYIDPSYTIRSLPANSIDAQLCLVLGQHAVHAGMAGRTNMLVGVWNQRFTHVPIPVAIGSRKQLDPAGESWQRVLEVTGQPGSLVGRG
jgi:6-phosphofructokinase 1